MAGEAWEYDLVSVSPVAGTTVMTPTGDQRLLTPVDVLKEAANAMGKERWEVCAIAGKDPESGGLLVLVKRRQLVIRIVS